MKTVAEIAKMFGVTRTTVYMWLRAGLPFIREKVVGIKARIKIDPADVIQYQKKKETP